MHSSRAARPARTFHRWIKVSPPPHVVGYVAGNFPLWLAPEQVRVLTLNADDNLIDAKDIAQQLRAAEVRVTSDLGPEPIKAKIADAESAKVHTMLVIGGRDVEAGNVSVRLHGKGNFGAKAKGEVIADILASIKERSGIA